MLTLQKKVQIKDSPWLARTRSAQETLPHTCPESQDCAWDNCLCTWPQWTWPRWPPRTWGSAKRSIGFPIHLSERKKKRPSSGCRLHCFSLPQFVLPLCFQDLHHAFSLSLYLQFCVRSVVGSRILERLDGVGVKGLMEDWDCATRNFWFLNRYCEWEKLCTFVLVRKHYPTTATRSYTYFFI